MSPAQCSATARRKIEALKVRDRASVERDTASAHAEHYLRLRLRRALQKQCSQG